MWIAGATWPMGAGRAVQEGVQGARRNISKSSYNDNIYVKILSAYLKKPRACGGFISAAAKRVVSIVLCPVRF